MTNEQATLELLQRASAIVWLQQDTASGQGGYQNRQEKDRASNGKEGPH